MLDSGNTIRSTGAVIVAGQREVAVREVVGLHLGVGQVAVLVVALHERDAQAPDHTGPRRG